MGAGVTISVVEAPATHKQLPIELGPVVGLLVAKWCCGVDRAGADAGCSVSFGGAGLLVGLLLCVFVVGELKRMEPG